MDELYTHLSGVVGDLSARNSSINVDIQNLGDKMIEFLHLQAITEDAEKEQLKVIEQISFNIISNVKGDLYHSTAAEEKLSNATNLINDLLGGGGSA